MVSSVCLAYLALIAALTSRLRRPTPLIEHPTEAFISGLGAIDKTKGLRRQHEDLFSSLRARLSCNSKLLECAERDDHQRTCANVPGVKLVDPDSRPHPSKWPLPGPEAQADS